MPYVAGTPIIDPDLVMRARTAVAPPAEKRAVIIPTLVGAGLGLGLSPRRNKLRGTLRGAGVGLTTGVGSTAGGLLGAGLGGLGGAALGGGTGLAAGLLHRALGTGPVDPNELARMAAGGAVLGGTGGAAFGGLVGGVEGGIGGYRFGRRQIWDQPWPDDRELPHGPSGAGDEDEGGRKAASFGARMGALAAMTRT